MNEVKIEKILLTGFLLVGNAGACFAPEGSDHFGYIDHCEETTVTLRNGFEIKGSLIGVTKDSLWLLPTSPVDPKEDTLPSRRFWNQPAVNRNEDEMTDPIGPDMNSPSSSPGHPVAIRDISSVVCGDPIWDGAAVGFITGAALGGMIGLAAVHEGGLAVIPIVSILTGPPCGFLGAIVDGAKGGRVRSYTREQLSIIAEGTESKEREGLADRLSEGLKTGYYFGPFYKRFNPVNSSIGGLNLLGGRFIRLDEKGIFFDISLGMADQGGEQWVNLGFDFGMILIDLGAIHPHGTIGASYYRRRISKSFHGAIRNPNDMNDLDVAWGIGAFFGTGKERLTVRPLLSFHYPLERVVSFELEIGAYYRF